jgi:hypothetical protein
MQCGVSSAYAQEQTYLMLLEMGERDFFHHLSAVKVNYSCPVNNRNT